MFVQTAEQQRAHVCMVADYLPVYFQACLNAGPLRSGVDGLPNAFLVAPFSFVCGVWVKSTKKYRIPNATGWILATIGFGLLSLLKADSNTGQWAGYQILVSIGTGLIVRGCLHHIDFTLSPMSTVQRPYVPRARTATALIHRVRVSVLPIPPDIRKREDPSVSLRAVADKTAF